MARRNKKPPPRVYHDGLIPAAGDPTNYQNLPEVVPDDHVPTKHEKSYPEVASSQSPSGTVTTPASSQLPNQSPLSPPPPVVSQLPLPRTSGVHSLQEAWSECDEQEGVPPPKHSVPLWRRPIVWVIAVALVIIVVLAGVLGGVATGAIKTAANTQQQSSPQKSTTTQPSSSSAAAPTPSAVTNPTCPDANNLNYTSPSSSSSGSSSRKTFRIQCAANYPGGDGTLGQQNSSAAVGSLAGCLDACAAQAECVGAVFRPAATASGSGGSGSGGSGGGAECWLKQFLGAVERGGLAVGMESGVLWQ
ncbi:uncharacterized protein THITE_2109471 [Thermothielavioides terrestris NRRL 8126]|uniref:Apple domain-containing protein n=1 Tax=Thermothielavioides terrestris (strain ATCC 38088 / NRRL 8126) TaxID=578455 RepID=G2QVU1_THETT|nr:uncharacterized protein THITE_2109471 [Thermothielavioides terrestris NRRL 8126]AEO63872.1 hypothetical protein THITE_2109471 [Thermothielavioides terrestris NRRL 8126]